MSNDDINDIDNDYDVELKINKENFNYDKVKKKSILLKGHYELPQNYTFISPRLSKEGKYLTAIGRPKNNDDQNDIVFIWNTKNLHNKRTLELKGISKIEAVDFTPDEKKFVIIYKDLPPVFFDYEKGIEFSKCQEINITRKKILSYSFSNKGKYFAMATDTYFIVYEIKSGKLVMQINSDSPIKVYRGKKVAFIDSNLYACIYDITKGKKDIIKVFKLTNIENINGIISTMMSPDKKYIFFLKGNGVYKIFLEDEKIEKIIELEETIEENRLYGAISEDCKILMTTNMTYSNFWDIESGKGKLIGFINKQKFDYFSVNFPKSTLVTCDSMCIDLTDIMDKYSDQKYIWLDLNPDKFMSFSFSPDYKVLLAKIDEHTAISYNCTNGRVIKKWKINLPNWCRACEMVPETSDIGVIATKSYNKVIKIWDYLTGTDLSTFSGFDVNNFSFNKRGNYLAAGTTEGEEIARVWDLEEKGEKGKKEKGKETKGEEETEETEETKEKKEKENEISFYYKQCKNNNKNTFVNLSRDEPLKVICVADAQNPVIFDLKTRQFILECIGCPIQLSSIYDVQSNEGNNYFYIFGKDINNILTAILYDFNGEMIKEYNNCRNIQFGKNDVNLLSDSDNINKGFLTLSHIDPNNINEIQCEMSGINSKFLSDNKTIVTCLDINENEKAIYINETETGEKVGEISYIKKTKRYTEISLDANIKENELIFRFIELRNPERK